MKGKTLLVLCFLGDPALPAVSVPNTGGYNVDIKELLDFLAGTSWNCVAITNTSIYIKDYETKWAENVQIFRIPVEDEYINQQEYLKTIFPRVLREVTELCQAIQPSLIHSHYWFSGYLAKHLSANMGIPFVHSAVSLSMDKINSGIPPRSSIQTDWENEFLPTAKAIFVITEQERNLLLNNYPVDADRVSVVGRGVSAEFRIPQHDACGFPIQLSLPNSQRLQVAGRAIPASTPWWNNGAYLFMGRLREIKGIDIIIRAWFQLYDIYQDQTAPLWIVGGIPETISELRAQLSQELDLARAEEQYKLVWWGYLSPAGISTLMLKSAVLLMHSRFEAGGRIILEAMSSRLPVIATPTGFAKDYVQDWVSGFLVEYGDVEMLTQRMELFLRQPLLGNAMGNNAYQTFSQMEAQWDCYGRHASVYRFVSEHPGRPLPRELTSLQPLGTITDFVKRGLLSAYPYCFPDTETLETYISEIIQGPVVKLEKNGYSHLWQVGSADALCVVKQFYSSMNEFALWNHSKTPKVLLAEDRYARAVLSCDVCGIVPAVGTDSEHFLLAMPERAHVKPSPQNYAELHVLLSQIKETPQFERIPTGPLGMPEDSASLAGRWRTLRNADTDCLCTDWAAFWKRTAPFLAAYWETAETATLPHCIVYGGSAWKHLCADEKASMLLYPTDRLYLGEAGFDQSRLWLECEWFCGMTLGVETRNRYRLALSYAGLSETQFKSWCLCLLCQGILRAFRLKTGEEERLISFLNQFFIQ